MKKSAFSDFSYNIGQNIWTYCVELGEIEVESSYPKMNISGNNRNVIKPFDAYVALKKRDPQAIHEGPDSCQSSDAKIHSYKFIK